MTLRELINNSNQISRDHGFWDDEATPSLATQELATLTASIADIAEAIESIRNGHIIDKRMRDSMAAEFSSVQIVAFSKLVLLVSEIGEAIDAIANMNIPNISEEMSDIFIRWADLSKFLEEKFSYESEQEITHKTNINISRPRLHGKKA